ncbi:MAG: NADAR family protein [Candidatus Saccharimonas sp.]|nr:NADAR family protein [Planctomycetaceae bacterium]
MQLIKFHLVGDDYGWLSNSAPYPISLESKMWYTAEHFFQTQKFHDVSVQKQILKTRSATEVIRIASNPKLRVRRDWDAVKLGFMRTAVRTKFTQISDLKTLLLNTGDAELINHSDTDSYWADGGDGGGRNMLGVVLMEVRDELRRSPVE